MRLSTQGKQQWHHLLHVIKFKLARKKCEFWRTWICQCEIDHCQWWMGDVDKWVSWHGQGRKICLTPRQQQPNAATKQAWAEETFKCRTHPGVDVTETPTSTVSDSTRSQSLRNYHLSNLNVEPKNITFFFLKPLKYLPFVTKHVCIRLAFCSVISNRYASLIQKQKCECPCLLPS